MVLDVRRPQWTVYHVPQAHAVHCTGFKNWGNPFLTYTLHSQTTGVVICLLCGVLTSGPDPVRCRYLWYCSKPLCSPKQNLLKRSGILIQCRAAYTTYSNRPVLFQFVADWYICEMQWNELLEKWNKSTWSTISFLLWCSRNINYSKIAKIFWTLPLLFVSHCAPAYMSTGKSWPPCILLVSFHSAESSEHGWFSKSRHSKSKELQNV